MPAEVTVFRTPVRCPVNPSKVFMRLTTDPDARQVDGPGEPLFEIPCRDCRQHTSPRPRLVLHRYDGHGVLVDTKIVP